MSEIVVALAGNPNVGKTALINSISGAKLKVGNWPGVTVEKKEISFMYKDHNIKLVDLPGIYSLTPFSQEERIARSFLLNEKVDVIIDVLDATNLERNLYLTTQLAEFGIPIVVALNFWDEVKRTGMEIDVNGLEKALNVPCIPTVATQRVGIEEILHYVVGSRKKPKTLRFSPEVEELISKVEAEIRKVFKDKVPYPVRWLAIKIVERDQEILTELKAKFGIDFTALEPDIKSLEELKGEDIATIIAEERYAFAYGLTKETVKRKPKKRELTDRLDSIFLHRVLGLPIFLSLIYLVFKLTFDGSGPLIDWADGFINGFLAKWVSHLLSFAPSWFQSLVVDGVIGGVGLVLSFVPLMLFLYFFLAVLEESGYMARAAFVMDRFMHTLGLHGKSFIPMIIGFGCNVPAVLATRMLENERDRKITALLIPFMSCGARLPIYALFTAAFFRAHQAEIVFLMYLIGVVVAAAVGIVLDRFIFKGEISPFIIELPPYRLPTFKMIATSVRVRTWAFVKKAGTVILAAMVLLWVFMNIPYGAKPENTVLGRFSRAISPIFAPCGISNWRAVAALIPGTVAKEVVVGALGQLYAVEAQEEAEQDQGMSFWRDLGDQLQGFVAALKDSVVSMFGSLKTSVFSIEEQPSPLVRAIKKDFTPLSAFSYMVFCLLWIPCVVTLGAIYKEFGIKLMWAAILLTTSVPYVVSTLVYNLGKLLGY
ncbi:ferrous iron transport protein B [Thermosulfidibacter takaii ABI70S6]|uniref:Ferrous iron transport protein B n=1 Tax=Thermosulfidibacter takaii (strain DSM 17441 / JCM 13301 / NBRC 103674 / ABI70S6) TaxID=1298851 RepID=A0A0S3QRY7_THET7|nr:ferrous iron transport protein B [Thermosulfidibacter takaii]BAT71041.1 ferrous iron transport protein B [Thermosulfidibacter takaii ABI70S6]